MGTIRKRFDIQITTAGKTVSEKFELDKTVKSILGILITSDREDLLFFRGEQKIDINGKEYFPEDYESKLLMTSLSIPANNRYYDLKKAEPGNGIITFSYTDSNHAQAPFVAYRVSLYVECEVEDGKN
jgi:hypothetical protein